MDIVVGGAGQDQVVQVAQVAQVAQLVTMFIIAARGKNIWTYRASKNWQQMSNLNCCLYNIKLHGYDLYPTSLHFY